MGTSFGAGDAITGGAGSDRLILQGTYSYTFAAASMSGIETLVLLAGSDTAWGGSGIGPSPTICRSTTPISRPHDPDGRRSQLRNGENPH